MSDKLQELTEKLYNEGLSKGREEGERMLAEAKETAGNIVAEARSKASDIIAEAEKKAEDIRSKAESDVRMASMQAITATRTDIERLLTGAICDKHVGEALSEPDFLKAVILETARKFNATECTELSAVLPDRLKDQTEAWVSSELAKALGTEIKASFSKKISGGFTIGPADGSYFISMSDETFRELISEYLRPVTRKLLFGE